MRPRSYRLGPPEGNPSAPVNLLLPDSGRAGA
jgi:hypothetical protein